jgi:hypothetical protein
MGAVDTVYRMIPVSSGDVIGDYGREISVLCDKCKHILFGLNCKAYPDGIPEKILNGEHDHRKPYENDKGIQFEPEEK